LFNGKRRRVIHSHNNPINPGITGFVVLVKPDFAVKLTFDTNE